MKKLISISLIVVLLATTLVGCGGAKFEDGTYEGEGQGMGGAVKVSVEVAEGKIASVKVTEHAETDGISDPAIEQIPALIVEKNSTDIDAVAGATITSVAIIDAVNAALEK